MLPLVKTVLAMTPKTVGYGPVQDVILTGDQIDLGEFPIQGCWPNEPAPLITWPLVVTKGPAKKKEDNFKPRHLSDAGDRQEPDLDALAEASRRRAAPRALEGGEAGAVPGPRW